MFLHGFDDSGADELENLLVTGIPQLIANDEWPSERPFVVLAPQHLFPQEVAHYAPCDGVVHGGSCAMRIQHDQGHPENGSICHTPAEVHDFLSYAIAGYDVDPDRVYLTGLSCGATAAWEYVAEYGGTQIAAMVPIAGEGRPAWEAAMCSLGEVAIWAFHGDVDDVVAPAASIDTITNLTACPPPLSDADLTVYPGVDHDSWTHTYDRSAGHDIYDWLLGYTVTDPAVAESTGATTSEGTIAETSGSATPDTAAETNVAATPGTDATGATTATEPESAEEEVATASTSPTMEVSAGWTNWRGDAGRTGVADAGPTGEAVQLWRVSADGTCNPPPAVVGGVVYAPCMVVLYALDAATGTERWRFAGTSLDQVTVGGDLVYVNDQEPGGLIDYPTTVLRALDAATGQERWNAAVLGGTSAVLDDGVLVIGTGDGFLLGLDPATGAERWRFQVSTQGAAHHPALADGIAYAGGDDGGFFAVDATHGTLLWRGDTGDDLSGTAVVAEGVAYAGATADGGHLHAFDAATGEPLWRTDGALISPAVLNGVGYSGGPVGTVIAFDTADGTERWQTEVGGFVRNIAIANDVIYALSDDAGTGTRRCSR